MLYCENDLEFQRSFQRGALFKVRRVDATRKPWLFYLENLVGKPVEDKSYYAEVKKAQCVKSMRGFLIMQTVVRRS